MSAATHLYRRKAVYYWRRRLPNALASWFHKRHLFLSLQTPDPNFARRLVVLLDAKLEEVVTAFEHAEMHLTPARVDGLLRDVVTKHLNKLERLSAAAKSFPNFDAAQAERDDRRAAWAYRLLHAQGPGAVVRPTDETEMSADGMTAADIAAVQDHLAMLRINDLVPTRHGILQNLLVANGAPANAMNLATAQDVYFRGMWMALAQSERRYGGKIVEAGDFVDQILKDRVRSVPREFETPVERMQPRAPVPYPVDDNPVQEDLDAVDDRFKTMADLLLRKRSKAERWTTKSKQQATQTFTLLAKFMKEERALENMSAVKQKDLAALVGFLETEIYKHHGKSKNDKNRSISEMRIVALSKPENLRGLEAGTLNRHLTFIDQLFDLAEAEGVDLDPKLKVTKLRAIDGADERERDERLKLPLSKIEDLFAQPPFVNCADWNRQSKEGAAGKSLVFHGALYFIPMLIFYGGGRREEYCGLMTSDVIDDNKGAYPYLHIAKNKFRRIKNGQSKRNIVIHPELIRLGFLRYVALIRSLGYELVFPDLFSATTKSP
ncbi:hypothetical protein Nham_0896 [Nitrobacter hamburgensis X14]|uniref:DUF6538 domain-containing protein n=1 Tax=Nitrobacter hamburgensis (strain DSM 10229 / NCIMB 13809 / X14) TaxID=323097 RepID=Q1QPT9_NITHX|nr:DUF6538 domain-containing protein [Nitrobacter hamburgensis]ABE61758.1 hypothetical protein Nham_0896 [Nitrobacter hamburgensis X14]